MKIKKLSVPIGLAVLTAIIAGAAQPALAAPGSPASAMTWTDLRQATKPEAIVYRRLWADKIKVSAKQWAASGDKSPVPAFTLSANFPAATPPVHASIFSTMFDCEMGGNGAGADLFARCTMRIATGTNGHSRVKEVADVCQLWVDPVESESEGPLQSKNYTSATLDANRVLHLRVVQYGKPVPACSRDIAVD